MSLDRRINAAIEQRNDIANRKFAVECADTILFLWDRIFEDDRPRRCLEAANNFYRECGEIEFTRANATKRFRDAERRMQAARIACSNAGRIVPIDKSRNTPWLMAREAARSTCETSAKHAAKLSVYYSVRAITAAIVETGATLEMVADARTMAHNYALEILNGNL